MAFRKQDRTLLAHWLKQQKQEVRKKNEALEAGKMWFNRARLAAKEGKQQLAQQAHKRALEAREAHDKAVRQLESIEMELDTLRRAGEPHEAIDSGAAARAEQIQQNFAAMGIDSELAELDELADRSGAERALGRLRQSLNGDEDTDLPASSDEVRGVDESERAASGPRLSELMEQGSETEGSPEQPSTSDAERASHDGGEAAEGSRRNGEDSTRSTSERSRTHRDSGVAPEDLTSETSDDGFSFEQVGPESE